MKHSSKYFCNTDCEYYPCHKGLDEDHFNCLFCYCPLQHIKHCPGTPTMIEYNGKMIKDCSNCVFPHIPENYEKILRILMQNPPGGN